VTDPRFVPTSERPVRSASGPTVSIVLAWHAGAEGLAECLDRVHPIAMDRGAEVVVVHAGPLPAPVPPDRYPGVRFFGLEADVTDGRIRAVGAQVAGGDVVLFADDRDPPEPDRLQRLLRGGSVATP
jgi:hypothetical protein